MAEGHPDAGDYVIQQVWQECEFVKERKDHALGMLALVVQKATATTGFAASEDAVKDFNEFVQTLVDTSE